VGTRSNHKQIEHLEILLLVEGLGSLQLAQSLHNIWRRRSYLHIRNLPLRLISREVGHTDVLLDQMVHVRCDHIQSYPHKSSQ
jgi:hypothetical protein